MSKFSGMGVPVTKPARMFITHPTTGEPLVDTNKQPAWIDVYSADSERARAFRRNGTQRRIDAKGRVGITAIAIEKDDIGLLAELTAGWHLVDITTGEIIDVEFSTQTARELYAEPEMTWLKDQVDTFAVARGNFLKPSAKGSGDSQNTNSQDSVA
jgi:hypothetical protein